LWRDHGYSSLMVTSNPVGSLLHTENGLLTPISSISLVEFTRCLLHARQRGRGLWRLWSLQNPRALSDDLTGHIAYDFVYRGQPLEGVRLIQVPHTPPPGKHALCPYGCKNSGAYTFLCHQVYDYFLVSTDFCSRKMYVHCTVGLGGRPICRKFPNRLRATSIQDFRRPRSLHGLDIFFR